MYLLPNHSLINISYLLKSNRITSWDYSLLLKWPTLTRCLYDFIINCAISYFSTGKVCGLRPPKLISHAWGQDHQHGAASSKAEQDKARLLLTVFQWSWQLFDVTNSITHQREVKLSSNISVKIHQSMCFITIEKINQENIFC